MWPRTTGLGQLCEVHARGRIELGKETIAYRELEVVGLDLVLEACRRTLRTTAAFSFRNMRSNSSGNPGHVRPDFLQFPHDGRASSHWDFVSQCRQSSVKTRRLAGQSKYLQGGNQEGPLTRILRLLHVWHPRLGLPVYTIVSTTTNGTVARMTRTGKTTEARSRR